MNKPEPVQENEMYTILWDFVIQMNNFILGRTPDLVLIKKETKELVI